MTDPFLEAGFDHPCRVTDEDINVEAEKYSRSGTSTGEWVSEEKRAEYDRINQRCRFFAGAKWCRSIYEPELTRLRSQVEICREALENLCEILLNNKLGSWRGTNAGSINAQAAHTAREAQHALKKLEAHETEAKKA